MLKISATDYAIQKHILKSAVVLIDTREQENKHITDYFDKKKIPYRSKKLDYGDYSLLIPRNEEYGIMTDMQLDFAVERKHSIEELSANLSKDRSRFEYEMWRGHGKIALLIENGTFDDILSGNYNTKYAKNSFLATLTTFSLRYDIHVWFTEKRNTGQIIYALLKYKLREEIK